MKPLYGPHVVSIEESSAAPIKIDDDRLSQAPCSPMGADNGTDLGDRSVAKRVGTP